MPPYPAFLLLKGRRVFVLGAGEAADRKAATLAASGAEMVRAPRFDAALLDGCALALGTGAPEPDLRALSAAAQARGIPVNIVDTPSLCSFLSPAIVDRAPLQVAIASGGDAPVLARLVRARIEALLPANLGELARFAARHRDAIRARLPDLRARRALLERVLGGPIAEMVLAGAGQLADQALEAELAGAAMPAGHVALLGTGPGAADLVTLRAQRLMGEADLVVAGPDVATAVLDLARRDAARLVLTPRADPVPALVAAGRQGQRVARLLAGDGRAQSTNEALALTGAGIAWSFIPGVSA